MSSTEQDVASPAAAVLERRPSRTTQKALARPSPQPLNIPHGEHASVVGTPPYLQLLGQCDHTVTRKSDLITRLTTTVLPSPPLANVTSFFKTELQHLFVFEAGGDANDPERLKVKRR